MASLMMLTIFQKKFQKFHAKNDFNNYLIDDQIYGYPETGWKKKIFSCSFNSKIVVSIVLLYASYQVINVNLIWKLTDCSKSHSLIWLQGICSLPYPSHATPCHLLFVYTNESFYNCHLVACIHTTKYYHRSNYVLKYINTMTVHLF